MARLLRASFLLLAVILTGCLDDSPFVPQIDETNFAPELEVDLAASTKTASGLYYRDILVGPGAQVAGAGAVAVTTGYSLYLRTGELIQSGDFALTLDGGAGTQRAIPGYEEGVRGMRVGGQRQLIIPPHIAYGESPPSGSGIPKNAILVYTITLTSID
jgi:FKBP-type peptidyl-prolyl cis-trans isomerase